MVGGGTVGHGDTVDSTDADVLGIGGRMRWRVEGVVPVPVKVVADDRQGGHLGVSDLGSGRVAAGVEFGVDGQAGAGGGRGDALHHDLVAGQRSAAVVDL